MPFTFRNSKLVFIIIILLALCIRIFPLRLESFDEDEMFSYEVASGSLASGLEVIRNDLVHPPFYYLLLHFIVHIFGGNAYSIRLISLVSGGLLTILAMVWVKRMTLSTFASVLTGCLLAASYELIFYSQQARSYALYSLLLLAVAMSFQRAVEDPKSGSRWSILSGLLAIAMLTHYMTVLYMAALALSILFLYRERTKLFVKYSLACLPAAALIMAWGAYLLPAYHVKEGLSKNLSWIHPPDWFDLIYITARFVGIPPFLKGTTVSLFLLLVLVVVTLYLAFKKNIHSSDPRTFQHLHLVFFLTFLPPIFLYLSTWSPISISPWGLRYVLPSGMFLIIFITLAISFVSQNNKALKMLLFLIFFGLQVSASLAWLDGPIRFPYDQIAQHLEHDPVTRSMKIYAIWNGIKKPVNYYSKDHSLISLLPDTEEHLPKEFVFIYRPKAEQERQRFTELVRSKWNVYGEPVTFHGKEGIDVVIVLMKNGS